MHGLMVRYEDKVIIMNEQLTLAPPICRLAGEFLSIDGEYGLLHLRGHLPPSIILVMVQALVLSQIRYCITVYGSSTQKNSSRIRKILNYAAKVIFDRRKFDHASDLLENLGWFSADQLTRYHSLCVLHKVRRSGEPVDLARQIVLVSETRQRTTIQSNDLTVPRSRSVIGQRRLPCRAAQEYNRSRLT